MINLFKSLAEFQNEVPIIHKGSKGYGYTYADLPAIFEIINPLLKKYGLGFYQAVTVDGLLTTVFHSESGEMIQSITPMPELGYEKVQKTKDGLTIDAFIIPGFEGMNKAQAMGSLITYFRRYAISAMLGLVTDKDADTRNKKAEKTSEETLEVWKSQVAGIKTVEELELLWQQNATVIKGDKDIILIFTNRKKEINNV
jgi:hypothetical protein